MKCYLTLFLVFLFHCLIAQSSPGRYLFILDGSGSMWQKVENQYKIETAKSVMNQLVGKIPDKTEVGLIAYGHRKKEDCNDIEVLAPLAPIDRALLTERIKGLNPQGKTPIALSIQAALDLLQKQKQSATIVLVSDGLETCSGDACALVKKARSQGIIISLHVIGFAMEGEDLSALECLAQAGGGQYFPAQNGDQLLDALNKSIEPAPTDGGYISIKSTVEGKLADASVKVFPKGKKDPVAALRTYENNSTNPRIILLPQGVYDVEVAAVRLEGNPQQTLKDLKVVKGDTLQQVVEFGQGTLSVGITRNGALSDASVTVYRAGTKDLVVNRRTYNKPESNPVQIKILPGKYDILVKALEIKDSPTHLWENITLEGGQKVDLAHDFSSGELKIGVKQGSAFVDAVVQVFDKTTGNEVASGRTYMQASSNPKTFTIPPGKYRVVVKPVKPKDLAPKTLEVEIIAEQTIEKSVSY